MLKHIIQGNNNLIGSQSDIDSLAKKNQARLLVISDSHGQFTTVMNIIRKYGKECDALVFCGDGAGDLIHLLSISQSDKEIKQCCPPVVAFARGNGDPSSYPFDSNSSISIPNRQTLTVCGKKILIVHGHRECVDFGLENLGLEMQIENCSVAFYGHTHIAREDNTSCYKFVNPGSCARPRGGQPACFAIATVEKHFVDIAFIKMELNPGEGTEYRIWNPIY